MKLAFLSHCPAFPCILQTEHGQKYCDAGTVNGCYVMCQKLHTSSFCDIVNSNKPLKVSSTLECNYFNIDKMLFLLFCFVFFDVLTVNATNL